MLNTIRSLNGAVTAPHHLAAQAGLRVLREGGTAVEAAVATGAALTVVYPQMNSMGGDGFWVIAEPGAAPVGVESAGRAAGLATIDLYREHGLSVVPWRGPMAANTVAGMVAGWESALKVSHGWGGRQLPLSRLFEEAIGYAENGMAVTNNMSELTTAKKAELAAVPGFAGVYLPGGEVPAPGSNLRQTSLGETLRRLAAEGLDDYYRGALARDMAADLEAAGSPVRLSDLEAHHARRVAPLHVDIEGAQLFNMTPPTQGVASLMILALFERLGVKHAESFEHVHGIVEASKRAFILRDRHVGCPEAMDWDPQAALDDAAMLDRMAASIDPRRAMAWPHQPSGGDTVWFGAIDAQGRAASVIQSTYFEYGSGVVLPKTGVVWQNRGASFRLTPGSPQSLAPFRKPFHTLNPAFARLSDGRVMVYGTMGGEGQPQTQAAVFTRYALFGQGLQAAVTAPRWLLGRTWGEETVSLKLESRFDPALVQALRDAGHDVELFPAFHSVMGHAGALVRHPDGNIEGATDPRADGIVAAY